MYQRVKFLSPLEFHTALKQDGFTLARHKIYRMCETGEISAWRNGAHWRIDANEVTALPDRLLDRNPNTAQNPSQFGAA